MHRVASYITHSDTISVASRQAADLSVPLQEERLASTLVGMATREQVQANVEAVLQALGVLPNKRRDEEAGVLAEVLRILEPVQGLTWPSGRPENSE